MWLAMVGKKIVGESSVFGGFERNDASSNPLKLGIQVERFRALQGASGRTAITMNVSIMFQQCCKVSRKNVIVFVSFRICLVDKRSNWSCSSASV